MPASKKTKSVPKKTSSIRKTTSKKVETKAPKKVAPKKEKTSIRRTVATPSSSKAKAIIVDVIEDDVDFNEVEENSLEDFLDSSLPNFESRKNKNEKIESEGGRGFESFSSLVTEDLDSQKRFFKELRDETKVNLKVGEELESQNQGIQDKGVQDLLDLFEDEDSNHKKNKKNHNSRRLNLYTKFVWKFLLIVVLLVVFVGYFSFSKLTIDIVPRNETLSESLLLKVSSDSGGIRLLSDPRENVSGVNKEIKISLSRDFSTSGEEFVGDDISGRVKIINN